MSLARRLQSVEVASSGKITEISRRYRLSLFGWSFVLCVLMPTAFAGGYFALIQSDQYVSEAHFTVRQASEMSLLGGGLLSSVSASMGLSASANLTTQDIFIVSDYIRSRSIIEDIGGKPLLYEIYAQPNVDWLSRLSSSASLEKIWQYWQNEVEADVDTPSGIITLKVSAFQREDAYRLAKLILKSSEALVNDISERSRNDALTRAGSEVTRSEEKLRKARLNLLSFRNRSRLIDPVLEASSISDTISKLVQDKLTLENNRAALGKSVSPDSPTIKVLNSQIASISDQIQGLQNQLTSRTKDGTLAAELAKYENLKIDEKFAEGLYTVAKDSYEAARREQEKQQLYLVTIDRPSMPENSAYPNIALGTFTIFASCLVLWSMGALLAASVRDHMGY